MDNHALCEALWSIRWPAGNHRDLLVRCGANETSVLRALLCRNAHLVDNQAFCNHILVLLPTGVYDHGVAWLDIVEVAKDVAEAANVSRQDNICAVTRVPTPPVVSDGILGDLPLALLSPLVLAYNPADFNYFGVEGD